MRRDKILVIGDTCKDIYVYCHCERLCPEGPVPVLDIVKQVDSYGMAGNVFRNIECLGSSVELITNSNKDKITKTRYVEIVTNHLFFRIDNGNKIKRIDYLHTIDFSKYSAVVIADYNKGFLNQDDIEYISLKHPLTFLDTKKIIGPWAKKIKFIKINRQEYALSKSSIEKFGLEHKIISTLGSGGCSYQDKIYPVNEVEVKDLSGAGDSFLAALTVKYLENFDITEALIAANEAATIVVQKKGTSIIKE